MAASSCNITVISIGFPSIEQSAMMMLHVRRLCQGGGEEKVPNNLPLSFLSPPSLHAYNENGSALLASTRQPHLVLCPQCQTRHFSEDREKNGLRDDFFFSSTLLRNKAGQTLNSRSTITLHSADVCCANSFVRSMPALSGALPGVESTSAAYVAAQFDEA